MFAFSGDGGGNMLLGVGEYRRGNAHRPPVEVRVAAAALHLLRAGEPDGAEALLTLVAGDLAPADPLAKRVAWHSAAKSLRTQGLSVAAIAAMLGRTYATVYYAVDENNAGQKSKQKARASASRAHKGGNPARIDDVAVMRPQRPIRAVLPPQHVKMAAAKSFAAGEINAIELGRILRGER
jgi:hypothetical protein